MTIEDELNKIDCNKLIARPEKTAVGDTAEHGTADKVAPPSFEQAELGVEGGAISETPAEAYRQGFLAGARVRKSAPGTGNGPCWNCGRDPRPPSHAHQVQMLK